MRTVASIFLFGALLFDTAWAGGEPPPLPAPHGSIVHVKDAAALKRAIEGAADNATIIIADGIYESPGVIYMRRGRNVTIRGASGDPAKVVIRGKGFDGAPGDDLLRLGGVENVTVACITFEECRSYGIKVEAENFPNGIHIYNCRFRDIGTRAIKGSTSPEGRAAGGSIRYCRFENTKTPGADWLFNGDYIGGIDMMSLDGWVISDNEFRNIKGRNGGGRAAIFVWVRSRSVIVERNLIVGCDRGIAFGNPSSSDLGRQGVEHVSGGRIQNNFIVPGPDAGIELWWVKDVKIYHNTVWRRDPSGRGLRGGSDEWPISAVDVANNIVRGQIDLAGEATERANLVGDFDGWFIDPRSGDLRLTLVAVGAIGKAAPVDDVTDDFNGHRRDATPDIGASEFAGR